MSKPRVLVTSALPRQMRHAVDETLSSNAAVTYLPDVKESKRDQALASADAVLPWNIDHQLTDQELASLKSGSLLQLLSAGVETVPFDRIPEGVLVASNAGAYARPMAEHVLAMALALAKHLPQKHEAMIRGEFQQQTPNREVRGSLVGILGFGGIGQASAKLFRALGARIDALNRSGRTDEPVDRIGTLEDLDHLLASADFLVVALPLTRATRGLLGERELSLMKADAILVNVARAAIIDEDALYEHLQRNPSFSAGIDAWWQEPRHSGSFATGRPFLELANVLGSPHDSAITTGSLEAAARQAGANVARYLRGEPVQHLVDRSDYVG